MENVRKHRDIKTLLYEFGMIILSQSTKIKQDYAIWRKIVSLLILKQKIFTMILLMMQEDNMIQVIMIKSDKRPLPVGINKKVLGTFKDELVEKIMGEFIAFRAKTYSFLIDGYNDEDYEKK